MSDEITYVIGDIHGCADHLDRLLAAIELHRAGRALRLVFLGDYVDRGPASARVLRRVRSLEAAGPQRVTCLAGNHEDMMLRARYDEEAFRYWVANGGSTTLASYGARDLGDLPTEELNWLASLPTLHEDSARYFVHAGLRPRRSAHACDPQDRLWIREEFLGVEHAFGKHVVHGHTPQTTGLPDLRRHRTNLDTGAVFGGPLTAGVFTGSRGAPVAYIQAGLDGTTRTVDLD